MYQELSAKVDKVTYIGAMNMTKDLYPNCKDSDAWNPVNVEKYLSCTNQISGSSFAIQESMSNIEIFTVSRSEKISIELEKILDDIELDPRATNRLEYAIANIRNVSSTSNESFSCIDTVGCLEETREVLIRLKMIEWGLYDLGGASAGLFLAYHHSMLGPYFGDIDGNEWPRIPLHKKPTTLENDFNQLLTNITFEMSNGTLKNVSILDLPAFGSTIGTLRKGLKEPFVWPIKLNFALIKTNPAIDTSSISASYKTLFEDWGNHMTGLNKNDQKHFTLEMKNNTHLNFTRFIRADMKTFLRAIAGNTISIFLLKTHYQPYSSHEEGAWRSIVQ